MYKIIGADKVEYGPVSAEQLRTWITEGRVNAQTMVQAEGDTSWKPLSMFPEFAAAFPAATPPPTPAGMPPLGTAPSMGGMPPLGTAPTIAPFGGGDDGRARAMSQVSGPAIALIVCTAIGIALAVLGILMQLLGMSMAGMNMGQFDNGQNAEMAKMMEMFSGAAGIVFRCIAIAVGIFIIFGCVKMKRLENYNLSLAACIIAMLPCLSPCCCLGIPFGIWAIVILNKPEVKQYFT